jgi:hypothetical protein
MCQSWVSGSVHPNSVASGCSLRHGVLEKLNCLVLLERIDDGTVRVADKELPDISGV